MYTNDYYAILDLKRDATDTQIKQAYRVAALHSHPLKQAPATNTPIDREKNTSHFRLVSEAYEVLSDPQKRALFDQYGEKGLKQGVPNGRGGITPTYVFSSNPETMFADHFGSTSPFADFFNHDATTLFTNTGREPQPQQLPSQEINLYCSLEELFQGCTKKVKATRKRVNIDGRTTSLEERVLTVDIRPGYKAGTKITFPKDGDEAPGAVPGDLVLIVREKPHPRLSRRGDDLVYRAKLSLSQALTGTTIEVETLDGRKLPIACAEIATPSSQQIIPHEGMPNPRDTTGLTRGNLIIEFDITFPSQLTAAQKQELKKILPA